MERGARASTEHTIHVLPPSPGRRHRVEIPPPVADGSDYYREFLETHKCARQHAVELRMVKGWPIHDLGGAW
jgi:hypothetical protein